MQKTHSTDSLARGFIYSCVLAIFIIGSGSALRTRLIPLAVFILIVLVLSEFLRRWQQTSPYAPAWNAIADFSIITILLLALDPSLRWFLVWVIIGDGILAGWKIALVLGLGASAINLILLSAGIAGPILPNNFTLDLFFWLTLTGIGTVQARQREVENQTRIRLENSVRVRSDRLSMLSHEIRTPLTLMRTSLEILFNGSAGLLTDKQRTFLETIYQNEERIDSLAQNLLTQAKLEAGVFSLKIKLVDLREIVRAAVADLHVLLDQRKQKIHTYYPQFLPLVSVDPELIRQVLINLIQNASRYSSEGGRIMVTITQNDHNLLLAVTDDGAGMGYEHRRKLFQHFSTSNSKFGEGTGLGLVIVKQIVEKHGGKIYVDTLLGRGTSFYITLPFNRIESNDERTALNINC